MRILPILAAVCCVVLSSEAQTNSAKYVPKAADMRIVEGKMYNRELSTNWVTLPAAGATLEVIDVTSDGVVVKGSAKVGGAAETMLIRHYPDAPNLTKGKKISTPFRTMPVSATKYGNGTVAAFDCGLANTPANRKGLTNGPIHAGS